MPQEDKTLSLSMPIITEEEEEESRGFSETGTGVILPDS